MAKYNQVQRRRINWAVIIAVVLALALVVETVGIFLGWFVQGKQDEASEPWNGLIATPENNGGIMKMSVSRTSLNGGEASGQADDSYTLTVTLNEDATYKDITWAFAWDGDETQWGKYGEVTEYFEVTPNGLTATARSKQALPFPVRVTATSDFNSKLSVSCKFDYLKELQSVTAAISSDNTVAFESATGYTLELTFGVGTVQGEYNVKDIVCRRSNGSMSQNSYFKAAQSLDSAITLNTERFIYPAFTESTFTLSYADFFAYEDEGNILPLPVTELSEEINNNLKAAVASVFNGKEPEFLFAGTYTYGEYSKDVNSNTVTVTLDTSKLATPVTDMEIDQDRIIIYPN